MIDIESEELISLERLPKIVPAVDGKRPHQATCYRWAFRGIRGIRLETTTVGGRLVSSREALHRFLDAVNTKRSEERGIPLPIRSPSELNRSSSAARESLRRMGVKV